MCGIVAYISRDLEKEDKIEDMLISSLKKLTYRGYDSWGMGFKDGNKIHIIKNVGDIENVDNFNLSIGNSYIGIAHTRWATHGKVTEINAHPHLCCKKEIAVVHNGIIENYKELKDELIKCGHSFISETDTEVIPHLIEEKYKSCKDFEIAFKEAIKELKGSFAIVAIHKDFDGIAFYRNGAPLIIGISPNGYFVSSDVVAFLNYTKKAIYLDDEEVAILKRSGKDIELKIWKNEKEVKKDIKEISWNFEEATKLGYKHFMIKEIMEQPEAIRNALIQNEKEMLEAAMEILRAKQVIFTACGTSRYAAIIGRYLFSKIAKKFCDVIMASEFHYFCDSVDKDTLVIAVSQSGETADVLFGVKKAKDNGAKIFSIVNVVNSTLARISDKTIYINAGPEICVAATKSFTNQLTVLYLLAYSMVNRFEEARNKIRKISEIIKKNVEENNKSIENIAKMVKDKEHFYYIGRGINFAMASEGALKLKEISYIHAEGMPAGELKHGTIALIEKNTPVVVIAPKDYTYYETLSNAMETKARGAFVIGVTDYAHDVFDAIIEIPKVEEIFYPLVTIAPLQLLSYYIAVERGLNPDKPRNLAKSVTVK
ncbi:MAG: glutamine--fructose-6-phosphate transaminase (isomerizing) [Candidatus Aenigmatarchaeota archaeon]